MQVKALAVLCIVFLLGCVSAAQQVRFDNTVVMTTTQRLGYANPQVLFRPGVEVQGKWGLFRTFGGLGSSRKLETGDGWVRRFRADAHFKFKKLLVGGGVSGARQTTSRWSKGSIHPLISGGFQHKNVQLIAAYILPGTDDLNGVRGVDGQLRFQLSRRVAFSPEISVLNFYSTGRPDLPRKFGFSLGAAFTYSFGNTGYRVPR
jgi:hypothetical protein